MLSIRKILKYVLFALILLSGKTGMAQNLLQTIRGTIIDQDSNFPIIGANVIVVDSDPLLGSSTSLDGKFHIENAPVGRVSLKITCMGYEEITMPNLLITSAKELILDISLTESIVKMDEIVISANPDNGEVLNEMATVSARAFSVEETKRYAGSFNDPARMVSSFAGVMPNPEGDNYIAVRGNSPKGNQWRLEGVEIPNPNHFSDEGSTGGLINALNSAMLANSDFLTGAFPAEYGNAFSGIFDMKLRNGNNQQREYAFSIGALGTEINLEGPFKKGGNSSYLFNYRYSTLALLENTGIVSFDGVPKYQDLSFKVNLPTPRAGVFSFFGLAGKGNFKNELPSEENEDIIISEFNINSEFVVTGLNHAIPLSPNTFLESGISVSENGSLHDKYDLVDTNEYQLLADEKLRKYTIIGKTSLHSKINAHHKISAGIVYTHFFYDFFTEYWDKPNDQMVVEQDEQGNSGLLQLYGNWKYRISEKFTFIGGMHYLNNLLNETYSIEPRAGLKWHFTPNQSLNFGFGIHSRMESLPTFFLQAEGEDGLIHQPNFWLDFPKSRQYVLGYQNYFTPNLMLKVEAYYQDLYNIAVENDPNSSFSMLNTISWQTTRQLVNKGTGYNYGLELTLERYFADTYYFMVTGSLYNSKYAAMDNITRDTKFNGNFVGNALFGKEFIFSKKTGKSKILSINAKVSYIGARRFSPINLEESREYGYTRVDESQAFTLRGDNIFIANLGIAYRINKRKTSQEIKLDIQNLTNNSGMVDQYYNSATDKIEYVYQLGMLPNIMYTIEF
jgi:hypothetical protein